MNIPLVAARGKESVYVLTQDGRLRMWSKEGMPPVMIAVSVKAIAEMYVVLRDLACRDDKRE